MVLQFFNQDQYKIEEKMKIQSNLLGSFDSPFGGWQPKSMLTFAGIFLLGIAFILLQQVHHYRNSAGAEPRFNDQYSTGIMDMAEFVPFFVILGGHLYLIPLSWGVSRQIFVSDCFT